MKTYTFFQIFDLLGPVELLACDRVYAENAEIAKEKFKEQFKSHTSWREAMLGGIWMMEGDHKGAFAFEDKDKLGMVMVRDNTIASGLN